MIFTAVWPQVSCLTPPLPSLHFGTWATSHGENLNQACASLRTPMQEGFVIRHCWVSLARAFPSAASGHSRPSFFDLAIPLGKHDITRVNAAPCPLTVVSTRLTKMEPGSWPSRCTRGHHICGLALGCPTSCGPHRLSAPLRKRVILAASWQTGPGLTR